MNLKLSKVKKDTQESIKYIGKWTFIAVLVGIIVGLAAVVFTAALNWGIDLLSGLTDSWLVYVLPVVGLFLSGWLTSTFAPEAAGHGTDAIIKSYNENWGRIDFIVVPIKLIASVFTIAFGGSAGREGPTVQMGGGLGYLIGKKLKLSLSDTRQIVICGMAASFGSIFTAPLAGGIFGAEVLYRDDIEYNTLFTSLISSITAYYIFAVVIGKERLFKFPIPKDYLFVPERDIILFIGIGVLVGLVSLVYIKTLYGYEELNEHIKLPTYIQTAIGGALTGLMAIVATPIILGTGMPLVEQISVDGGFTVGFLVLLLVGKILATSFTIGSGGSGGVVAPSLTIGAISGAIFASILNYQFPLAIITASAAGVLGSAAHIPLTTAILIAEIFGIELIIPGTIVCFTGAWIARSDTLYRESYVSRFEMAKVLHHFGDGGNQ
ncbi:MAG: chloride channel protein [Bacillota bacterium]